MRRRLYEPDHEAYRDAVRAFLEKEAAPNADQWERAGLVPRDFFTKAGAQGFLGVAVPEQYGGGGVRDFRFNTVWAEECARQNLGSVGLGLSLHTDIAMPYFLAYCNEEQRNRWLPGLASGELFSAIAMTEPGAGSDLAGIRTTALRDGDDYIVNGAKTFITNGINADIVIVAVKTDPTKRHAGMSLLVVEGDRPGFTRGRNLEKLGLHGQDTAELFFDQVRVPTANLLGEEGQGFRQLVGNLPQERLSIAVAGVAAARAALDVTLEYVRSRSAFGAPVATLQNTRFRLAEVATEVDVAQAFVDQCVLALTDGELSAEDAAEAKWWCTELQGRAVDTCLQLHGGYGYMLEYPIARMYADARVTRIYGGTTEIMKEIVGRGLGLR